MFSGSDKVSMEPGAREELNVPLLGPSFYPVPYGLCWKVTCVWELVTFEGTPFPAPESRLLESLPIPVHDSGGGKK